MSHTLFFAITIRYCRVSNELSFTVANNKNASDVKREDDVEKEAGARNRASNQKSTSANYKSDRSESKASSTQTKSVKTSAINKHLGKE